MTDRRTFPITSGAGSPVQCHVVFTDVSDGDLSCAVDPAVARTRRSAVVERPWSWVSQVHGSGVVEADRPTDDEPVPADGLFTTKADLVVSIQVADCAPVLMWAPTPTGAMVAAVHAGWRGVVAGVLTNAVDEFWHRCGTAPAWTLGPCICAAHYEFSEADLDPLMSRFGERVRGTTAWGTAALDLRAAVGAAMAEAGCGEPLGEPPTCTLESDLHWSHRGEASTSRQLGAIWWTSDIDSPAPEASEH